VVLLYLRLALNLPLVFFHPGRTHSLLQIHFQFDDCISVILREHRPLLLVEKFAPLRVELFETVEVVARDHKGAEWAPVIGQHISLQIRCSLLQPVEALLLQALNNFFFAQVRHLDDVRTLHDLGREGMRVDRCRGRRS